MQTTESKSFCHVVLLQARDIGIDLDPANVPADEEPLLFNDAELADTLPIESASSPFPVYLETTSPQHLPTLPNLSTMSTINQQQPVGDWVLPMNLAEGLAPSPHIPATVPSLQQGDLLSITLPLVQVSEATTCVGVKPNLSSKSYTKYYGILHNVINNTIPCFKRSPYVIRLRILNV